jgi:DNA-directed RNA polymerase subunit RPC12/RpoP
MISDWTIYAVHIGFGEWLCPTCANKRLLEEIGPGVDVDVARQLWLAGKAIELDGNEESKVEPMISVEIDQFMGSDEVHCEQCSRVLFNEREVRTYQIKLTVTSDDGSELPDDEGMAEQVVRGLAPVYGEDNLTVDTVEPEVSDGPDDDGDPSLGVVCNSADLQAAGE